MDESLRSYLFPDGLHDVVDTLPEARDSDYHIEVLKMSTDRYEAYLNSLIMKATNLGISIARNTSVAESNATVDTNHARSESTQSQGSASTTLTLHSFDDGRNFTGRILPRRRSRALSFSQYGRYLSDINPSLGQPKFISSSPSSPSELERTPSLFSMTTKKSYRSLRKSILKIRGASREAPCSEPLIISCSACREELQPNESLQKLPCGHSYCPTCLRIMINQATTEESKMPPRCCTQPIPSCMVKSILSREDQTKFLKAVLQYSTPWETRIFCSNPSCGEFIPQRAKLDPKHPFQAMCRKCRTQVCVMCKRNAHPLGQDCPGDRELDAVLKIGEKSGWRRCYKCRTLVELTHGCTHMTCRCRAQFCYICGAVWDPTVGCPNFCNGDEEMERRRQEEEERIAALEAEEALKQEKEANQAAENLEAEARTRNCDEFKALHAEQTRVLERFASFEQESKWLLWTRHARQKLALVEKHSVVIEKMKERHDKTSGNLEDRQVISEWELRKTLDQSAKNVRIRLKHMEAYCDALGRSPDSDMPSRIVTEMDLRELSQQYALEQNMKQLHAAKINVLRDRQAKALEELVERQKCELNRLREKNAKELEQLESDFADEEDSFATLFSMRQKALDTRWRLEMEILCKELEDKLGVKHAVLPPLAWPQDKALEDGLAAVPE